MGGRSSIFVNWHVDLIYTCLLPIKAYPLVSSGIAQARGAYSEKHGRSKVGLGRFQRMFSTIPMPVHISTIQPHCRSVLTTKWFINDYIPRQTIPILRRFSSHVEIRTRLNVGIRAGDKKADIVDKYVPHSLSTSCFGTLIGRIVGAFRALKAKNDLANYTSIRGLCENEGNFVGRPTATPTYAPPPPTFGGVANGMNGMSTLSTRSNLD